MNLFRTAMLSLALLLGISPAVAQWQTPNHSVPIGRGVGVTGFGNAMPGIASRPLVSNGTGADPTFQTLSPAGGGTGFDNSVNAANDVLASNGVNGSFVHTALTALINTMCISAPSACASVFGYANVAWYGAVCDGITDDHIALQAWANALRNGGNGFAFSALGCVTSATIQFMPSTNAAPVQGPHIIGNLKLIGNSSLPINNDLLQVWNPTAVSTTQNFYFAQFDSLELSKTTGTGNCLSLRGFWGRIGQVFARTCGADGIQFPNFLFGGVPDEYESNPTIGEVTCIDCLGYVVNNQIGIGATPRFGNIRGTVSGALTNGLGALNASGSEQVNGNIAYTGGGWGAQVQLLGAGGRPHEVYLQGAGDIDCAQNGVKVEEGESIIISGHRLNFEPPGFCNAASWPLTGYSFGKVGGGNGLLGTIVNPYITLRPGVTKANIGTFMDFNNDAQIANLVVNVEISDQTGLVCIGSACGGTTLQFADLYKNINVNASMRIVQNGITVYDNITNTTFAGLPPCVAGMNGSATRIVTDSTTVVQRAAIVGGGGNIVKANCIGTAWVVGG